MKTITVKEARKGDFRCGKCGGQMMVDDTCTRKLPMGFGFRGTSFVIDSMKQTGYFGECLKCGKKGAWYVGKAKLVTSKPRGINQKIKAARKAA
jgi:hypothetical protein